VAATKIWGLTNEGITGVKYSKKDQKQVCGPAGACFGYSLAWLKSVLEGKALKDSKPGKPQALILQQKFEMITLANRDTEVRKVAKELGLEIPGKTSAIEYKLAPQTVSTTPGWYLVEMVNLHWVAMGSKDNKHYYMDPNFGLFQFDKPDEFKSTVLADIDATYKDDAEFNSKFNLRMLTA
jgi:hypothetical protein